MLAHDDVTDVDRVLAGDASAYEGIVRRWQGPIINLAYRFCRDRSRAEDLAQEAFLRAFRNLGKWRREAAFSTWLFALATNLYRSELRRIPPTTFSLDSLPELSGRESASRELEATDQDRTVRRALDTLPTKYREAVILFYFRDMNVAAAAESLQIPEGTLKARLSRARGLLRRKLRLDAAPVRPREV